MARLAMLVRQRGVETALEYCTAAALVALAIVAMHGFGDQLGIVFNNASRLAE